jgi:hypothetical protein
LEGLWTQVVNGVNYKYRFGIIGGTSYDVIVYKSTEGSVSIRKVIEYPPVKA